MCSVNHKDIDIDWKFLKQFADVRHCIIHANGNNGRMANPKVLDEIVALYPQELSYARGKKLKVSDGFIKRCIDATEKASLAVIHYMNMHNGYVPSQKRINEPCLK